MNHDLALQEQLTNLLLQRQAHMIFEDAVANFPEEQFNTRPQNLDYRFWHLLEHIRICQYDILDYIRNPNYKMLKFPDEYWPDTTTKCDPAAWNLTIEQFYADRQALLEIIEHPETDFYTPIAHGWDGHNILREILIVADHNAYHIGEFGILRQLMELW